MFRSFDDRMSKSAPGAGCTDISAQNSLTTQQRWEQLPSHLANTKAQKAGDPPESWQSWPYPVLKIQHGSLSRSGADDGNYTTIIQF